MLWSNLLGHSQQQAWFASAVGCGRLASTFLFVGPDGIGKRTFARLVAKSMLCPNRLPSTMVPCGHCESCVQVDASTHPDLLQIEKSKDASSLSIDKLVGPKENRMREGLCYELHIKPFGGMRRIAIIDDADTIHEEAANSMLKTLEEPPSGSLIFLIGTNEQRQLATIRSRSQVVRFRPLTSEEVATLLVRNGVVADASEAQAIASQSDGSIGLASLLTDQELREFRAQVHKLLSQRPMDFVGLAKSMLAQSQSVGEEGAARRTRLKLVFAFAADFYRSILFSFNLNIEASRREPYGNSPSKSPYGLRHEASNESGVGVATHPLSMSAAARALQSCLDAQAEVDRNLTPAGLLESWAATQAEICHA